MEQKQHNRRLAREKRTVHSMVRIYCRGMHGTRDGICADCRDILDCSFQRLDTCRLLPDKPTCAECPVHCYKPEMRERVVAVMRYAGPRMAWRHPVLALLHALDGMR